MFGAAVRPCCFLALWRISLTVSHSGAAYRSSLKYGVGAMRRSEKKYITLGKRNTFKTRMTTAAVDCGECPDSNYSAHLKLKRFVCAEPPLKLSVRETCSC